MMTLGQVHAWLPGSILFGDPNIVITRVHTDTRSIQVGDLFVALSGDQYDGNAFVEEAIAKGAVAVISQHGLHAKHLQGLEVVDTKLALGTIAASWRALFNLPFIAVTGSNGKTTVTQMLASILRAHAGEQSLATVGNLNNDIGVPLTLMRLNSRHNIAVVELGMNHPGEISYLSNMVKPTVVLVNNAQREHLEFMVSVEAVAHENGSAISELPIDGIAVYPADDAYSDVWKKLAKGRETWTFSLDGKDKDVTVHCLEAIWTSGQWHVVVETHAGKISFNLHVAGRHNVKNALAAITCSLATDIPLKTIEAGLQAFSPVKGRSFTQSIRVDGRDVLLIDDTYNSNPDSMKVAIDALAEMTGPRLIVMGDMGEVGEKGLAFHAEMGEYAQKKDIQHLFAFGTVSQEAVKFFKGAQHFQTIEALNSAVLLQLGSVQSILVKGSRFMKMERVLQHILAVDEQAVKNAFSKEAVHVA
jgi:UDP-N-acetylmuramoyl-tripeptide--D-alanyl-D-alanine ligase